MSNNSTKGKKAVKWDEVYVLTDHWKSDLAFYKDDLQFLHHLVDKYIIWITKEENLGMVREIMQNINELERRCEELLASVGEHMRGIGVQIDRPGAGGETELKDRHHELEGKISLFIKDFRANRKEVFRITEYVMDSEHLSGILRS